MDSVGKSGVGQGEPTQKREQGLSNKRKRHWHDYHMLHPEVEERPFLFSNFYNFSEIFL